MRIAPHSGFLGPSFGPKRCFVPAAQAFICIQRTITISRAATYRRCDYPNPNLAPHIAAVHDYVFNHMRCTGRVYFTDDPIRGASGVIFRNRTFPPDFGKGIMHTYPGKNSVPDDFLWVSYLKADSRAGPANFVWMERSETPSRRKGVKYQFHLVCLSAFVLSFHVFGPQFLFNNWCLH